jgi:hypothetical protein
MFHLNPQLSDGRLDRIALVHAFCPVAAHLTVKPSRGSSLVKVFVLCTTTRERCIRQLYVRRLV